MQTHDRATSELHIFLVTKRRIKKGHEILLDYGEVRFPTETCCLFRDLPQAVSPKTLAQTETMHPGDTWFRQLLGQDVQKYRLKET